MRNKLPYSQGKEKVDLLNEISRMSELIAAGWDTVLMRRKYDTIKYYGLQAFELATKIHYDDGIAAALINLNQHGSPESVYQVPLNDKDAREKNIKEAIAIAEKTKNYKLLGQAYGALGTLVTPFQPDSQWIDRLKKQEYYFQLARDSEALADIYVWATENFSGEGNYEKAFEYGEKAHHYLVFENVMSVNWHQLLIQFNFEALSELNSSIGDYEKAMTYLQEENRYALKNNTGWKNDAGIARLFYQMHQYDSATLYWNYWRSQPAYQSAADGSKAFGYGILADIYIANKKYDSAIAISRANIPRYRKFNNQVGVAIEMGRIGKAYAGKASYDSAVYFMTRALPDLEKNNNRPWMMESYRLLATVYHYKKNEDSAYKYLQKYTDIKDSLYNKQLWLRLFNQKLEAGNQQAKTQLLVLNKDNALKTSQLKEQTTFRNFIIVTFVALLCAGLYIFRNINLIRKNERLRQDQKEQEWKLKELENENKQVELQKQSAELEMQALRAQMNPHFIFNSLSSINHFILKNESKTASNYLTRFSRLIRMVLVNSQKPLISLQEELEMLRIYLDMERLRTKSSFDYFVVFKNEIDAENVFVPPLILQPFCENALWHGLMHKEGPGNLTIDLAMNDAVLDCVITDNGVGREKAAALKSASAGKEKSLGLQITTQRLALLNQNKNVQTYYTIEDMLDEERNVTGTKVVLKISHQEVKREYA
jgi:hypothetical protein